MNIHACKTFRVQRVCICPHQRCPFARFLFPLLKKKKNLPCCGTWSAPSRHGSRWQMDHRVHSGFWLGAGPRTTTDFGIFLLPHFLKTFRGHHGSESGLETRWVGGSVGVGVGGVDVIFGRRFNPTSAHVGHQGWNPTVTALSFELAGLGAAVLEPDLDSAFSHTEFKSQSAADMGVGQRIGNERFLKHSDLAWLQMRSFANGRSGIATMTSLHHCVLRVPARNQMGRGKKMKGGGGIRWVANV